MATATILPTAMDISAALITQLGLPQELVEQTEHAVGCQIFVHRLGCSFVPLRNIWASLDFNRAYKDSSSYVCARWKHGVIQSARDKLVKHDFSLDAVSLPHHYNNPPPDLVVATVHMIWFNVCRFEQNQLGFLERGGPTNMRGFDMEMKLKHTDLGKAYDEVSAVYFAKWTEPTIQRVKKEILGKELNK